MGRKIKPGDRVKIVKSLLHTGRVGIVLPDSYSAGFFHVALSAKRTSSDALPIHHRINEAKVIGVSPYQAKRARWWER